MATELPQSEFDSFYEFLGRLRANGGRNLSPEESVEQFRAYQQEAERFVRETQNALAEHPGEAKPLDDEAFMRRVHKRISEHGSNE